MSANKAKGTRHETSVVNYLNDVLNLSPSSFGRISRHPQTGREDQGDIHAYPFILEAKDEAKHDIPGYIRQANREALNAGFPYGVAVVKKRNANIKDAYAVMDLETFAKVLAKVREAS